MIYHNTISKSLKERGFRVGICDNVVFANKENIFINITNRHTDLTNMTTSIIIKNLLTDSEVCCENICFELLENSVFLSSNLLMSLIDKVIGLNNKFVFKILVRNIRDSLYLTQEQFAKRINVPISTYRKWEQGVTTPSQVVVNYVINKFFWEG